MRPLSGIKAGFCESILSTIIPVFSGQAAAILLCHSKEISMNIKCSVVFTITGSKKDCLERSKSCKKRAQNGKNHKKEKANFFMKLLTTKAFWEIMKFIIYISVISS